MPFMRLKKFSYIPISLRFFFYHKRYWIAVNAFSASVEVIIWFLFFILIWHVLRPEFLLFIFFSIL